MLVSISGSFCVLLSGISPCAGFTVMICFINRCVYRHFIDAILLDTVATDFPSALSIAM